MKSKLDSFFYDLTFRKQIHDNVNININVIIRDWESFDTLFFFTKSVTLGCTVNKFPVVMLPGPGLLNK